MNDRPGPVRRSRTSTSSRKKPTRRRSPTPGRGPSGWRRLSKVELGPIVAVRELVVPGDDRSTIECEERAARKRLETAKFQEIPVRVELLVRFEVHPKANEQRDGTAMTSPTSRSSYARSPPGLPGSRASGRFDRDRRGVAGRAGLAGLGLRYAWAAKRKFCPSTSRPRPSGR